MRSQVQISTNTRYFFLFVQALTHRVTQCCVGGMVGDEQATLETSRDIQTGLNTTVFQKEKHIYTCNRVVKEKKIIHYLHHNQA